MTVPRVVHVWQTLFQHIYIYDQRLCCKWFTFYDSAQPLTNQIANSFHWLAHTSDADQILWEHCKLLYAVIYSSCLLVTQQKNSKHAITVWSASFCFNFSCSTSRILEWFTTLPVWVQIIPKSPLHQNFGARMHCSHICCHWPMILKVRGHNTQASDIKPQTNFMFLWQCMAMVIIHSGYP